MNKLLIIFFSSILFISCEKENNDAFYPLQLNCNNYSSFIHTNYQIGAKFFLISEINNEGITHPNYNNPQIDTNDVNTILSALQKIYDLNIPESDTVFNYY